MIKKPITYEFDGTEIAVIKQRILGLITEVEAAKRLGVTRQSVGSVIARYLISEIRNGKMTLC